MDTFKFRDIFVMNLFYIVLLYKMKRKMRFNVKPLIALEGGSSIDDFEKTIMGNKKVKKYYKEAIEDKTISSPFSLENLNIIKKKMVLDKNKAPKRVKESLEEAVTFINDKLTDYKIMKNEKEKVKKKPVIKVETKVENIDEKLSQEKDFETITNKMKTTQHKNKYIKTLKSSIEKGNQLQQVINNINDNSKFEKLKENIEGYMTYVGEDEQDITPNTIRNFYSFIIDNYEKFKEKDTFDEVFSKLNNVIDELDLI